MTDNESRLLNALAKIAEVANDATNGNEEFGPDGGDDASSEDASDVKLTCTPKALPKRLLQKSAENAVRINPVNAPALGTFVAAGLNFDVLEPQHMSVLTSKYWGATPRRLTVSFMETTAANLRARIVSHMNAWTKTGCISFVETSGTGDVRISRGPGGYYSYLGTDIRLIPRNRQTMNLESFTMSTPESEYKRVVRHETGHTLGAPHEHMRKALVARVDPQKAYEYFLRTQGWDKAMVDAQVLTPLNERSLMSTPADQTSIMCYQLPGSITRDGRPIVGGLDINATDFAFIGKIYPKATHAMSLSAAPAADEEEEWSESEDVEVPVEPRPNASDIRIRRSPCGADGVRNMGRLIEVQNPANVSAPLALHVNDVLHFNATGGHVRSGEDVIELLGPFLPAVLGDDGDILTPMGPPNTVLFRALKPGSAVIDVVTGDPWGTSQTATLTVTIEK